MNPGPRNTFGPQLRLSGRDAFAAVFANRLRKSAGPIAVCARPNALPHLRLGLSVGRRVGGAVQRSRLKRLLREAFRLGRHDWPVGFDIIVIVYPHVPLTVPDYQRLLAQALTAIEREQQRRDAKSESPHHP